MLHPGATRQLRLLDPLVVAGVLVVLLVPVLVAVLAARQPVEPVATTSVPLATDRAATAHVRAVPVFAGRTPAPSELADPDALRGALADSAEALLGRAGAAQLMRFADQETSLRPKPEWYSGAEYRYPYRYPELDRFLDARLDAPAAPAVNDLAALFVHAAALRTSRSADERFPQAGSIAFALLDRSRAGGQCEPQLNLAFLLSAEIAPRDEHVATEYERAARACPDDPTPLWLLGQFLSLRADWPSPGNFTATPPEVEEVLRTFEELRRRLPDSSAGWSGAGDAELRLAYRSFERPFSARVHFRRALALYREAERMDDDAALRAGIARAHAGLGDFDRAVAAQRQAVGERSDFAPLQARLVEYLERAGDFAGAAAAAEPLIDGGRFPEGEGMFPVPVDQWDPWNSAEDGRGPVSVGTDRFLPVSIDLGSQGGGIGDALKDIAFIPTYHDVPLVTGHDRWCPGWSAVRDRVIAEGFDALTSTSQRFQIIRHDLRYRCGDVDQLAAIAALEAGDPERAVKLAERKAVDEDPDYLETLSGVHDARQNLWRFAGDMDRARRAVEEWREAQPTDALAFDRAGELEYLEGRFADAREHFAAAVRLARAETGFPSAAEAEALVKLGAALAGMGRHAAALDVFAEAAAAGSRAAGLAVTIPELPVGTSDDAEAAAYHAMAQSGYSALRLRRLRLAVDAYEDAVGHARTHYAAPEGHEHSVSRPEVAYNNLSIAQARRGELEAAERSARSAVERDSLNPYSLATLGYAQAARGRTGPARESLRAAVHDFPDNRAAWNDLGVVEARAGRLGAAVEAFRHAVGVDERYALGWFNLGVALEQRGPLHAVAAQGAFGRAGRADAAFRERKHDLTLDDAVVFADLDLSKPLPARWSFAGTAPAAPVGAVGLGAVMLLGIGAARAFGGQGFSGADRLLQSLSGLVDRGRAAVRFGPAVVAVLAVDAVFVVPAARSSGAGPWSLALTVLGVTLLVALVMRARAVAARRARVSLQQKSWTPTLVVALVAGVFGVAWAPLPVALTERPSPAVHWIAPLLTAALALALFLLAAVLQVPLARQLGTAALVMTASALTPVRPLDGGAIADGSTVGSATLALVATGLLVLLGLA